MKNPFPHKVIIFALIALVLGVMSFMFFTNKDAVPVSDIAIPDRGTVSAEGVIEPTRISIPSIGVDAIVSEVGVDKEGRMDVPKDVAEVGWYEPGYKPGEMGSAAFAGHVNSRLGLPAVFRNLEDVEIGETFSLWDADGREMVFKITEKNIYDFRTAPLEKVYGPADLPTVSLITCDDDLWLGSTYKDRLVVTGVLVTGVEEESDEVL